MLFLRKSGNSPLALTTKDTEVSIIATDTVAISDQSIDIKKSFRTIYNFMNATNLATNYYKNINFADEAKLDSDYEDDQTFNALMFKVDLLDHKIWDAFDEVQKELIIDDLMFCKHRSEYWEASNG